MLSCLSVQAMPRARARGFALIIAISLMAFIILLLVSLSQFMQIETKMSTTQNAQTAARSNAVLGLKSALGQMQSLAGPDQRVTATAGLLDGTPGDSTTISGVNEPYWTGVWNSTYPNGVSVRSNAASLQNYRDLNRRDPQNNGTFMAWLVSDSDNFEPQNFDRNDPDVAVQLVGEGSVEDENTQGVYAPKVAIEDDNNTTTGHYAYWVGDEGVKARFDAIDAHQTPGVNSPVSANVAQGKLSMLVAQRLGVENTLDLNWNDNLAKDNFEKANSQRQLGLLDYNGNADTEAKNAFHSISFASTGVLSNVRDGGLKKDLTSFLEAPSNTALPTNMPTFGQAGVTTYTQYGYLFGNETEAIADFPDPTNVFSPASPTWEQLRTYTKLKDRANNSVTPTISNGGNDYPVGPVLIRAELNVIPEFINTGGDLDTLSASFDFRAHVGVRVILWNPYNVDLSAHNYEVEVMVRDAAAKLFPVLVKDDNSIDPGTGDFDTSDYRVITHSNSTDYGVDSNMAGLFQHPDVTHYLTDNPDGDESVSGFVFKIDDVSIPAGGILVYSLDNGNNVAYDPSPNSTTNRLAPGDNGGTVYLDYGNIDAEMQALAYSNDVINADTSTTKQIRYPRFIWRNWNNLGEDPEGSIASMALLEPVDTDSETRDLFDTNNSQVIGLDRYFSRLHGAPLERRSSASP